VFAESAGRYWLSVLPHLAREIRHWRAQASQIPDPVLRRLALATQRVERGNLEGAAAFGVLVPRAYRARVVRALVAYQATYDYVDTLAEQPSRDPIANGRQLHMALLSALEPGAEHPDYYRHHRARQDGGYIRSMIDACREAFGALPSYASVAQPALRAASRIVAYQSLNHEGEGAHHRALARWAADVVPQGSGLRWWEAAAGAASSLGVFALIAAAAKPGLSAAETRATEEAYFPWIGALHVLLDSLVDHAQDVREGQHSIVDHYATPAEAASRLQAIAARAMRATEALQDSSQHALMLAAMSSFYLSMPGASSSLAALPAAGINEAMGGLATPTMAVFGMRRAAGRLLAGADPSSGEEIWIPPTTRTTPTTRITRITPVRRAGRLETQVLDFPLVHSGGERQHDRA
jgi:tetraprenyl-beta-curcumene synthase